MKILITILFLSFSALLKAPEAKTIFIRADVPQNPFEALYIATSTVESSNNPLAVGDKHLKGWSYGIVQVRESRLDDYYRRTGIRYTTDDMFDPVKARRVFMHYASDYNPYQIMEISRAWNGGPDWRNKKSTKGYWKLIQKQLNN